MLLLCLEMAWILIVEYVRGCAHAGPSLSENCCLMMAGESCSVEKELESTTATNAVYQDKTNILFSVKIYMFLEVNTLHPIHMCPFTYSINLRQYVEQVLYFFMFYYCSCIC